MSPPMISKAAARYTGAGGKEHCSLCRHFSPRRGGRCARVLGDISPMGWCRLFSREMRGLVADASSFNGGGGGPALGLDFMVPGVLDPLITFTRASTATYFDAAGVMQSAAVNAPRWDYDPATLQLRGLLIEEARTNLLLNSATLSTQSVAVTAQAYTLSFYGTGTITKSGTATGALVGTGAAQRVSQTFTPTAGTLTLTVTGSVTNAQLEAGAFATSYILTTSAAVTRAVEVMSLPTSPWYNAAAGSLVLDVLYNGVTGSAYPALATLGDGTVNNVIYILAKPSGLIHSECTASGVSQWGIPGPIGPTLGVVEKVGVSLASNNINFAINGVLGAPDTVATLPVVTTLFLGCSYINTTLAHAVAYRRVRYWSRALSTAELQTVTTL